MSERRIEADYVIVGAGAVALAFADTVLSQSEASLAIVDRRQKPGGHWNDAYPFVRLHSPSLTYGVNSRALGSDRIETNGLNRGLYELAGPDEICAYFDQLMQQQFLPSGRVTYLPLHDYSEDGVATSLLHGEQIRLSARKKLVDGTLSATRLPATHPPAFPVADGATCIPPHGLARLKDPGAGFVVIGAGKTAMDTAVWLLQQGVEPDAITWIRPRDGWLLGRGNLQPSFDFFAASMEALALELEAAAGATSHDDLFARLEAAGQLKRIDPGVTPTMYRCAIVSDAELEQMRRIRNVVRLGHVTALEPERIVLERGSIPTTARHVHINCTADGIAGKPLRPIFETGRILLQYVRRCSPTFSGAFIGHVETMPGDDAEKNRLCRPVPLPREPLDWLRMYLIDAENRRAWSQFPEIQAWLAASRLDRFSAMAARAMREPTPANAAILERYRRAMKPGMTRLQELAGQFA
jgi:hypothetical protein